VNLRRTRHPCGASSWVGAVAGRSSPPTVLQAWRASGFHADHDEPASPAMESAPARLPFILITDLPYRGCGPASGPDAYQLVPARPSSRATPGSMTDPAADAGRRYDRPLKSSTFRITAAPCAPRPSGTLASNTPILTFGCARVRRRTRRREPSQREGRPQLARRGRDFRLIGIRRARRRPRRSGRLSRAHRRPSRARSAPGSASARVRENKARGWRRAARAGLRCNRDRGVAGRLVAGLASGIQEAPHRH